MLSKDLIKIHKGARAFHGSLLELLPDVESFQNEVYNAQPLLGTPKDSQHSLLENLHRQMELLQSQVIQMKSDVCGMKNTILLMVKRRATGFDSFVPATAVKYENMDGEEDNCENLSAPGDDDSSKSQFSSRTRHQLTRSLKVKEVKSFENKVKTKRKKSSASNAKSKCFICDQKISNRSRHMKKYHPGQKNFPCKFCGKAFNIYKDFQNHKKTHAAVHSFKCDLCNATLKSIPNLSSHLKSHTGEKCYVCHICGRNFKSKMSVTNCKHRKRDPSNPGFECKSCGNIFLTLDQWNLHLAGMCGSNNDPKIGAQDFQPSNHTTRRVKKFQCKLCPKSFHVPWLLRQHMNVHTGETPFRCEYCYKQFHTSKEKGIHKYLKHSGTFQGYKCKICGTMCKSRLGRETHYLTHSPEEMANHNVIVKMVECDVCGKVVRKNYLTNHKKIHASKDSFICEICGKGFKRAVSLKEHTLAHGRPPGELGPGQQAAINREKNHVCNVCGKAFYDRCHLLIHNRVHTGERPFRCDICGKAFTTFQAFKNHGVVHTKIKAFKCEICGDSFTLQRSLKRHYSVHTGEKPFQCDFCGKRFVQKVHLDCHRRVHTGERPFQCNYCGKKFADPSTLYKHKAKHEKELQDNIQKELQGNNVKKEFQGNFRTELQGNIKKGLQNNIQNELQNIIQNELQNNIQTELQNSIQNELQNSIQNELQNNIQNELQNNFQKELQHNTLQYQAL